MSSGIDREHQSIYNYDRPFSENYLPAVKVEPAPAELLEAKDSRFLLGQPIGYPIG
jgi:hypothetical protein